MAGTWDVAIGPDDTIYVAGNVGTVKYSAAGVRLWFSDTGGRDIKVASDGTVYLLDSVSSPVTGYDYSLRKIDANGKRVWEARHSTLTNDYAEALESDHNGSIYVTGSAGTVKYTEYPVPSTQLAVAGHNPGGVLELRLTAEAGRFYAIETSADLRIWTTLTNFVNQTGTVNFSVPAATSFSQRFYRAAVEF